MKRADDALPGACLFHGLGFAACLALAGCFSTGEDGKAEAEPGFHYHPATGQCLDAQGKAGLNAYDHAAIFRSKQAECVDLSGTDLSLLENHERTFTKDTLKAWDFRGARFDSSYLHFYHMTGADLRGADMAKIDYGYAIIEGTVDDFTQAPPDGCTIYAGSIRCLK